MKRRDFVKNLSLASVGTPFLLNDLKFQTISKPLFPIQKSAEDKVLVIIRLGGGNDGLNTVIPLESYDNLANHRSNIIIPQNDLLSITNTLAFHPTMTGMQNMFNDGKLSIIQNVGYPEQNRSHFRSTDIWDKGLMEPSATTGWMGRNFDNSYPNFPEDYPNDSNPDPFAITMGSEVSATCQGLMGNFSHSVSNPFDTFNLSETSALNDGSYYGSHMEYLSTIIGQTNAYGSQVNDAANNGSTLSNKYDDNNPLAVQLRYVAQMISGGLQTKVYILNINGFDTHDSQVSASDVKQGNHTDLLKTVSDAIEAFQDDLALLNLEQRVAGMTYSEFGRQIASNASLGTDHGDAAPLFMFGSCVGQLVTGSDPVIGTQIQNQEGLPMEIDFRDIYASVLRNWFEVGEADIQQTFEHQVTYYQFLGGCSTGLEEENLTAQSLMVYPNPAISSAKVRLETENEWTRVEIIDINGSLIDVVYEGNLSKGEHHIPMNVQDLSNGQYIIRVSKKSGVETKNFVKAK